MDKTAYFLEIPIEKITPSKLNPRTVFDQEKIHELAESFSERGIIQPIIVYTENGVFRIICGERRWRAAQIANINKIPAIVHPQPISDEIAVSMALIENMHRQNVDVVSEAAAIRSLVDSYSWKVTKVSKELGVSHTYIHKRLLITKHADVLDQLTQKLISFSEAYELATLNDFAAREWFLERLKSKEFYNFKEFVDAISRYRKISHLMADNESLSQPLNREKIEFEVKDLRYCDSKCDHYLRLTWDEKQHFKIPSDEPGWSEFCTAINNICYVKKREAKEKFYETLRSINEKMPIPDDGWESMLWFQHSNKMCKSCDSLIDAFDFENIGDDKKPGVFAYCINSDSKCYKQRCRAYEERKIKREQERIAEKKRRKDQILNSIEEDNNTSPKTSWAYITKRECVYLLMQFLIYAGGQERIQAFAKAQSFKNMPAKYSAQVIYIRNKLLDTIKEKELIDLLFAEAAASAAFVQKTIEPKKFNRAKQQEFPIIFMSCNG